MAMSVRASRCASVSFSPNTLATSAKALESGLTFQFSRVLASWPSAPLIVRWIRLIVLIGSPVSALRWIRAWLDCLWS